MRLRQVVNPIRPHYRSVHTITQHVIPILSIIVIIIIKQRIIIIQLFSINRKLKFNRLRQLLAYINSNSSYPTVNRREHPILPHNFHRLPLVMVVAAAAVVSLVEVVHNRNNNNLQRQWGFNIRPMHRFTNHQMYRITL